MINFFSGRKPKVLLLNNNRRETGAFAGFISGSEFEILTAGRGDTGVSAALRERPSVIVLDCELPGNSGWETLSALKNNKRTAAIPVLVRAARGSQACADKALAGGAQGYLTKNDRGAVVASKLSRRLGRGASF
jgi:DNA-binding response OmpR family regulator